MPLYRSPQLDALEFLTWGRRVAAGDFAFPFYPTHGPIYPLFLGALLGLFGERLDLVRLIQAALGAGAATVLAALSARLWVARAAGITTGVVVALYGPLAFVDTALWEEGLLIAATAGALWCLLAPAPGAQRHLAAGLLLGVASAIRPTLLLVALVFLARLAWRRQPHWRRDGGLLALGLLLLLGPAVAGASRATGGLLFVRGFGAINVWIGNDPAGGGIQNARLGGAWDRLENEPLRAGVGDPGQLERFYLRKAVDRALADPLGLLRVQASKLLWLTQAEEPRDNHALAFFRERSRLLRWLPGFWLLLPLAILGGVAARSRPQAVRPLLLYLAATAAPVLVALAGLRYRLPMIPALALLAGPCGAALAERARERRWRALALALAIGTAIAAATLLRSHPPSHSFAEEWALTGSSLVALERYGEAEAAFRAAIAADPASALGWDGIGRLRLREGRLAEAEEALRTAVAREPDFARSHYHLGLALRESGHAEAAAEAFEAALAIAPRHPGSLEALASLSARLGRLERAASIYRLLLEARPSDAASWLALARIEAAQRQFDSALAAAERAAALAPGPEAWLLTGFVAIEARQPARAERALREVEASAAAASPETALLAAAVARAAGRGEVADARLRALLERLPRLPAARELLLRNASELGRRAEAERFLADLDARRP